MISRRIEGEHTMMGSGYARGEDEDEKRKKEGRKKERSDGGVFGGGGRMMSAVGQTASHSADILAVHSSVSIHIFYSSTR